MKNQIERARGLKQILDNREKSHLFSLACFSSDAVRQRIESNKDDEYRQAFSADADRILNSLAYTRYIDKTQVFSLVTNDHLTHRVIHVQLVARIARTIGRYLGLNEDLIEAASLGHDIGHPPFGHDGERFLSKLTHAHKAGYFHHNLQSIQFLDRIERNGRGWNLTLQTLDAIICHDGEAHASKLTPKKNRTFDMLYELVAKMQSQKACNAVPMTLEGCVVRLADTISYIGRDMEDAVRLGMISRDDLPEKSARLLGRTNGTIVFNLVTDLINNSLEQPSIGFSEEISDALRTLKAFNYQRIYKNPIIKKHLTTVEDIFKYLFEKFMTDLLKEHASSVVFTDFLNGMDPEYIADHSHAQIVRDYISGMTDSYFIRMAPQHLKPASVAHV